MYDGLQLIGSQICHLSTPSRGLDRTSDHLLPVDAANEIQVHIVHNLY